MGAYAYCTCGAGLSRPTVFEVVYGTYECGSCKKSLEITDDHRGMILMDLDDRIDELTTRIQRLEEPTTRS